MANNNKKAVPVKKGRPRKLFDRDIVQDRKISKYRLDEAAELQGEKIGYWLDLAPKAKTQVEEKELELEALTGQKYEFYRNNLDGGVDSKGQPKIPTDTAITRAISCDDDIVEMKAKIIELQEYLGLINSAIKTMENVRTSIKVLNELHTNHYFELQGLENDKYEAREVKKEKKAAAKNSINASLKNMNIPEEEEDEELPGDEEIEEDVIEDEIPEEPVEDVDDAPAEEEGTEEPEEDLKDGGAKAVKELEEESTPEEESAAVNPCPCGYRFGKDFGEYEECDDCDEESACFQESKKNR